MNFHQVVVNTNLGGEYDEDDEDFGTFFTLHRCWGMSIYQILLQQEPITEPKGEAFLITVMGGSTKISIPNKLKRYLDMWCESERVESS